MGGEGDRPNERGNDELIVSLVRTSPLPFALVDVESMRFRAVSEHGAELLGVDANYAGDVLDLTAEPEATRNAIDLMRRGTIDAYEARRDLRHADGDTLKTTLWVRHLANHGFPGLALLLVLSSSSDAHDPELPRLDPPIPEVGACSADSTGRIDRVSREIDEMLGKCPTLRGSPVTATVHPDDVDSLVDALALTLTDRTPVGVTARFGQDDGTWRPVRLVVAAEDAGGSDRLGLALMADDTTNEPATPQTDELRTERLERTLLRISTEIQALGLAPRMAELPNGEQLTELADLTSRQWEIVSRLLQGQRVPAIARAMYLSPSTVRNHLSAVFGKLGVHSQHELIETLRARMSIPPSES